MVFRYFTEYFIIIFLLLIFAWRSTNPPWQVEPLSDSADYKSDFFQQKINTYHQTGYFVLVDVGASRSPNGDRTIPREIRMFGCNVKISNKFIRRQIETDSPARSRQG